MNELISRKWLMDNIDDWDCDDNCCECEFRGEDFCVEKSFIVSAPTIEPNLILPERMERGDCYEVGETIVVMNHDDYYDLLMRDEPKQGEWIVDLCDYKSECSVCGADEADFIYGTEMWYGLGESKFCPNCGCRNRKENE